MEDSNCEKKGLLSVIIPVYNGEMYLKQTVQSILQSKYSELEIILVDDGSGEECRTLCDYLAETNENITCYHKENGGIADARNCGLEHAKGEYIGFCDQDDIVKDYAYSMMIEQMEKDRSDGCIAGDSYYENGKEVSGHIILNEGCFIGDEIKKAIVSPMILMVENPFPEAVFSWNSHIGASMFRRKVIREHHIFFRKFLSYEDDYLFGLDYFSACKSVSVIKKAVYMFRQNPLSESHSGKYYRDFYKNSMRLERYVDQYAKQLPIDDESYLRNRRKRIGLALCANLDNECRKGNPKTIRDIYKELKQVYGRAKTQRILSTMDTYKTEKRYIMMSKLLGMGYIRSAYWINCFLLRYLLPIWVWLKRIKER